jgi:hypothetical protein
LATAPMPARGEVWMIDFDPSIGSETRKVRPALVVSLDAIGRLPLRLVVPITDWKPQYASYPWFTLLPPEPASGLIKKQTNPQSGSQCIPRGENSVGELMRVVEQHMAEPGAAPDWRGM